MQLKVVASSSEGNCYILESDTQALIIECGKSYKDVMKALNFNVSKIVGCIVTHEHGDHAKYYHEFIRAGIDVYSTDGTRESLKEINGELTKPFSRLSDYRLPSGENVPRYETFNIGGFTITPFQTIHEVAEPCGFIIEHEEMGELLFATDTEYIGFNFKGLNHILCEANYDKQILERGVENFEHVLRGHMEIGTTERFIKQNATHELMNVVLIHLSQSNASENKFVDIIQRIGNFNVCKAYPGLTLDLNKEPF
ncbi:MAG: MBL fold metallo-hydrolase [Lachnospiraceae bacterium]|nr:MBL fold metallo-hydrolase [Lachnospiraceae bacterium]